MMREQGAAIVQFTYTKQGQIKRLRLLRATKSQELNDAAIQTIIRASASFPKVNQDFTLRLPIIFKLTRFPQCPNNSRSYFTLSTALIFFNLSSSSK